MNKLGANPMKSIVAVGELAIPPDCDSGRCGFKPRRSPLVFTKDYPYDDNIRFCGFVIRILSVGRLMVWHQTFNLTTLRSYVGSIPARRIFFALLEVK